MAETSGLVITRHRERLACIQCRRRKLKCDRASPCNACLRRGDEALCLYQRAPPADRTEAARQMEIDDRLQRLERLVRNLTQAKNASVSGASEPSRSVSSREGQSHVRFDDAQTSSVQWSDGIHRGDTHWSVMLNDIQDLYLDIKSQSDLAGTGFSGASTEGSSSGIDILFGNAYPTTVGGILAQALPSRSETDKLIASYFRLRTITAPFIHPAQFRRQYRTFWNNQQNTSPLWISILFSILYISSSRLKFRTNERENQRRFEFAAAQCLVLGRYNVPQQFCAEAITLYGQSHCLTNMNMPADIGPVFAVAVRVASSMGYHRDPGRLKMKPFEKEMRRRTWSFLMQLDLLTSFHLGLPSNVQYPTWNTGPPACLRHTDFDEDTEIMPTARPEEEPIEIQFYVAKHRIMSTFEKIMRHINTAMPINEARMAEVDDLDAELRHLWNSLPDTLRSRSLSDSLGDTSTLIVTRLCVSFLFRKCLCVLHRPYLVKHRQTSTVACSEASSGLLADFLDVYEEFLPSGQLEAESFFLSSLTWHDFLLAITTLSLVICEASRQESLTVDIPASVALLERAGDVCMRHGNERGGDSKRVHLLIIAVVQKFKTGSQIQDDADLTMSADFFDSPGVMDASTWAFLGDFL